MVIDGFKSNKHIWHRCFIRYILELKNKLSFTGITILNTPKLGKSPEPGNVSSHLVSSCAEQLGPSFHYILGAKKMEAVYSNPSGQKQPPKVLNDYRSMALTSLVMKSFVLMRSSLFSNFTEYLLDPSQFTYRARQGVKDATATLLNIV